MCKKNAAATCLEKQDSQYMDAIQADLKVVQDPNETPSKKRKHSESIGEKAAIASNAKRYNMDYSTAEKSHEIFSGCGVPDLTMKNPNGELEVKEAKGGKSSYGDRKAAPNSTKRVKQCTPEYSKSIANNLENGNYKGRHPTRACATHAPNPVPSCKNCVGEEAKKRKQTGKDMNDAYKNQKLIKVGIRGDYNETCATIPEVMDRYGVDNNGKAVPVK